MPLKVGNLAPTISKLIANLFFIGQVGEVLMEDALETVPMGSQLA